MNRISASIVMYKNKEEIIGNAIDSFLNGSKDSTLYLIDNSPTNQLQALRADSRIVYLHRPLNPGFGAGHNMAIELTMKEGINFHFIINPDVYFGNHVIDKMVAYISDNENIGMLMPEVLNEDGTIQYLPKLIPGPLWIVLRKIKWPKGYYRNFLDRYELRRMPRGEIYNAPLLSGCFSLLNLPLVKNVGFYDDNFFMYFEDFDLSRRVHEVYKTLYFPEVSIYHGYESGANKSAHLFKIFLKSACYYFNKWGWIFDVRRRKINKITLHNYEKHI